MAKYTGTTMSNPRTSDLVRNLIAGFIGCLSQDGGGQKRYGVARQALAEGEPRVSAERWLRAVD
jgi:hypothetical protein